MSCKLLIKIIGFYLQDFLISIIVMYMPYRHGCDVTIIIRYATDRHQIIGEYKIYVVLIAIPW